MSVLIKGMEMPKSCLECKIKSWDEDGDYICPFSEVVCLNIGRQYDCPLIEVPDHGRLIDADEEIEVWDVCGIEGVFPHSKTTVSKFLLGHCIGKIPPTVIPASGGSEK